MPGSRTVSRRWSPITRTSSAGVADHPDLIGRVPSLAPGVAPPPAEPGFRRRRLFEGIIQLVLSLVHDPFILVVENAHWADDTSLDVIAALARRLGNAPILIVLTYRTDERNSALTQFLAALDRDRLASEVALRRLPAREVGTMIQAITGSGVAAETSEAIAALTDGNPFFVEEVLEAGVATPPRSVLATIQRRAVDLSPRTQTILNVAAVAGRRFDFAVLEAVTSSSEGDLIAAIQELIAAQFVAEDAPDSFTFRRALTRQAIHGHMLARTRRSMHQAIAEAIERIDPNQQRIADLAYHSYEAGRWDAALAYSRRAGPAALAVGAPRPSCCASASRAARS